MHGERDSDILRFFFWVQHIQCSLVLYTASCMNGAARWSITIREETESFGDGDTLKVGKGPGIWPTSSALTLMAWFDSARDYIRFAAGPGPEASAGMSFSSGRSSQVDYGAVCSIYWWKRLGPPVVGVQHTIAFSFWLLSQLRSPLGSNRMKFLPDEKAGRLSRASLIPYPTLSCSILHWFSFIFNSGWQDTKMADGNHLLSFFTRNPNKFTSGLVSM